MALLAARICGFFGINPIAGSELRWATVSLVTPRSEAASLADVLQLPTGPEPRRFSPRDEFPPSSCRGDAPCAFRHATVEIPLEYHRDDSMAQLSVFQLTGRNLTTG
jgi:hypothetical protein